MSNIGIMSDSDVDPVESPTWAVATRGRRGGGPGRGVQQPSHHIQGALGLVPGGERMQQHQTSAWGHYPKIITRRAEFRQVNCCCLNLSSVKTSSNKLFSKDLEVDNFILRNCNLKLTDLVKICYLYEK